MKNNRNIIVFIFLLCYIFMGMIYSSSQGFWHDEIYTFTFLKGVSAYTFQGNTLSNYVYAIPIHKCKDILQNDNFLSNFQLQILHEGHPPLYFIFLKIWTYLFGYSELALRSFSLLAGVSSIIVLISVVNNYFKSKLAFWIILFLLLFNPFLFYYFTEARMYALAFLFATLCFKYWLKYKEHKRLKSLDFLCFSIASIALLYTHYYGIFFFLSLGIYDLIRNKISLRLNNYFIPLIIFSPWIFVIKLQTEFHNIHWTDGSFSFFNSLIGFFKGLISLFYSPMSDSKNHETVLAIVAGFVILYFVSKTIKLRLIFISMCFLYFLQIFIFDQVLDHHTIVVPRYYIFILIFFYWAIAKTIEHSTLTITSTFLFTYLISSGFAFYKIYSKSLAPKQMYRELASYIDSKHNPQNTLIVVEPGGPIIWGLSYYLKYDFNIISAAHFKPTNNSKKIIYVDEMLGDKYWENKLNTENQKKLKLVPFAGVFLYE